MTLKDFFSMLDAPLTNARWSWGGVRRIDNAVILRVWQDELRTSNGREFALVLRHVATTVAPTHGHRERMEHLDLIRGGAPCYLVMCEAVDTKAARRRIRHFNSQDVFSGGALEQWGSDWWIERRGALPVEQLTATPRT
jgi:hypothetical protein